MFWIISRYFTFSTLWPSPYLGFLAHLVNSNWAFQFILLHFLVWFRCLKVFFIWWVVIPSPLPSGGWWWCHWLFGFLIFLHSPHNVCHSLILLTPVECLLFILWVHSFSGHSKLLYWLMFVQRRFPCFSFKLFSHIHLTGLQVDLPFLRRNAIFTGRTQGSKQAVINYL